MRNLVEDGLHDAMVMSKDDTNKVSRYDVASTRPGPCPTVPPDEQRFSRCGRFWKVTDSSEETSARYASQGAVAKATKVAASIYGAAKPKLGNPRAPATKKPLKPLPAWNDGFGRSTTSSSSAPVKPRPGLAAHRANVRTGSNKAAERAPIVRTENIPKEAPKKSKYGDVEMRDADDDADEADETVQTATMTLSDSEVGDEVGEVDVADSSAETMKGEPTLEMYENEMKRLKEREEKLKKKMFAMRPDVNYETMAEVEEGWLLSGSRPDPRASERTGPRVMYSANPKYRIRTADGKYVIPETVDSTAGPRPEVILDDFDNPAGEQKPVTKMTKAERLAAEAEAIRIAEIKEKEAAERAKREAAAAKSSIMETELKFYRDTAARLAKEFNELKRNADAKEKTLQKLTIDLHAQGETNDLLANDAANFRGGGGSIQGVQLPPEASLAGAAEGPSAELTAEALLARVEIAEREAEEEIFRTAQYGHMILRMRETNPTDPNRMDDPFGSIRTSNHNTAMAAAGRKKGDGRNDRDKFESKAHVPWLDGKIKSMNKYQDALDSEIAAKTSVLYKAEQEREHADAMMEQARINLKNRRDQWADQINQKKSYLIASRAEDAAEAKRKANFRQQLAKIRADAIEMEYRQKGGAKGMKGMKGNLARGLLGEMDGKKVAEEENKLDAALKKLSGVVEDISPDGLIASFNERMAKLSAFRDNSSLVQAKHDDLVEKHKEIAEELKEIKEKLLQAAEGRKSTADGRPEDVMEMAEYRMRNRMRVQKLILDEAESQVNNVGASIHNMMHTVIAFEKTIAKVTDDGKPKPAERRASMTSRNNSRVNLTGMERRKSESGRSTPASGIRKPSRTNLAAGVEEKKDTAVLDMMNREAREGMKYLTTFFEKIDQANIITAADVHKAKMLRLAKLKGTNVAGAVRKSFKHGLKLDDDLGHMSEDERHAAKFGLVAPANPQFNQRVVTAEEQDAAVLGEMDDDETGAKEENAEAEEAREKLKVGSVKLFRKSNAKKKDEGEKDWADEQEARLSRTKLPEAVKAA